MLELSDPTAQLEVVRAEIAALRAEQSELRQQVAHLTKQNEALVVLGQAALGHILVAESRRHRRRSEQRPLPPIHLPPVLSSLLSGELQTLLGVLLPHVGTPPSTLPAGPALPPPEDTATDDPEPAPPPVAAAQPPGPKTTKRHRSPGSGRRALAAKLPRETQSVLPLPEACVCPQCARALRKLPGDTVEALEWKPASFVVLRIERPRFACAHCKNAGVVQAPTSGLPLEGVHVGPGLLAQVVVDKFCDGLPLYRQEQRAARQGVSLPRSSLCRWLGTVGPLVRTLVDRALVPALQEAPLLHTDATGLPVMAQGSTRLGHVFVYLAPGDLCVFRYASAHTTEAVRPQLENYGGRTVCDGATIYHALFEGPDAPGVRGGCWSHARRHLAEARGLAPESVAYALDLIGEIFEADRRTQALEGDARTQGRAAKARPVVERLQRWMHTYRIEGRKDPLSQAIRYLRNQWERLTLFLTDGTVPLTNNPAERALRSLALGRKNWLWVGSDVKGEDAAAFLSLLGTCRTRGIEPWVYLKWLFERLERWPQNKLHELAPRAYQELQQALAQAS